MPAGGDKIFLLTIEVGKDIRWTKSEVPAVGEGYATYRRGGTEELELTNYESIDLVVELLELITCLYRDRERGSRVASSPPDSDRVSCNTLRDHSDKLVRHLGAQLYRVLFKGELHAQLTGLLNDNTVALVRIHLAFLDDASRGPYPKIQRWPWEFVRVPDDEKFSFKGDFLALRTEFSLARRLTLGDAGDMRIQGSVRVLFVVSSPETLDPIDGQVVGEKIKSAFGEDAVVSLIQRRRPQDPDPEWKSLVTYRAFCEATKRDTFNIVHLVAHGVRTVRGGEIAFCDENGHPQWISGERLASDLAGGARKAVLKLVFLQVCESAALPDPFVGVSSVAQVLAEKNIPAVIGMQAKIEQGAAAEFAESFYAGLANLDSVDVAVREGRAAIAGDLKGDYAFGLPVIYLQSYQGLFARKDIPMPRDETSAQSASRGPPVTEVVTPALRSCPNCGCSGVKMRCRTCGLWLACPSCKSSLPDPLNDTFCDCGHRIERDNNELRRFSLNEDSLSGGGMIAVAAPDEFVARQQSAEE
jgi:hypothetical protein